MGSQGRLGGMTWMKKNPTPDPPRLPAEEYRPHKTREVEAVGTTGMPTVEGESSARCQLRRLQDILSAGPACVIPFLTEFSSIPLQAGGERPFWALEAGLPPSMRAPCANSGGERCRIWVGLGRRVWQWVRRPPARGCGLAACRQAAPAGQQLRDGADVFIIVGHEGLHHVFGDSSPFLTEKAQVGKTHAFPPHNPEAKTEALLSPRAWFPSWTEALSFCEQPTCRRVEPSLSCKVALLGRLLRHKITWIFLGG